MKATEIMIGDWVLMDLNYSEEDPMYTHPNYQPYKIQNGEDIDLACETNCIGDADVYQPISITPDILEKNGFVLQKESSIAKEYICACGGGPDHNLFVTVFKNRDFVKVYYCPIDASTMIDVNIPHCAVHQLQHALRLCDIEKEITL